MNQDDNPRILLTLLALGIAAVGGRAGEPAAPVRYRGETPAEHDARMQWWRDANFGMFIHWGVYSQLGGNYKGKESPGSAEWILRNLQIPMAEYEAIARQFNPVNYDPDAWVRLAKEAGMKYIVITAKHHDGFALFDSRASDWNVVKATPYGKDLLKPLAEACKRHGIRLGFYYSQGTDWYHPGGSGYMGPRDRNVSFEEYFDKIAIPQVKELLAGYGDIATFWFDHGMPDQRALAERMVTVIREAGSDALLSSRLLVGGSTPRACGAKSSTSCARSGWITSRIPTR